MRRKRKGVAAVEFAIILPVLLTLLIGAIEYGRAIQLYQIATTASCIGARVLAATGDTDKASALIKNYLEEDHVMVSTNHVLNNNINTYTVTYGIEDRVCRVGVSINYDAEAWSPRLIYVGGETINATSVYRLEKHK